MSRLFLGGAALPRCGKWLAFKSGFSRGGEAAGRKAKEPREKLALNGKARPERLRPHSQQSSDRCAETLRHPKSSSMGRFSRSLLFSMLSSGMLLCALATPARAAHSAPGDAVLRALREEMERSKANLKLENVPAPYYIEYRVTEIDQFEASAVFGALRNQQHNHGRLLRVVVRVGDYKQDSFFGTGEGTIELVPSDEDVFAIRHRIWLATDRAYKAATETLSAKQAALKQLKVDEPVDDFAKASPLEAVEPLARFSSTDFSSWLHLLEEASAQYRTDKELENFESALRFTLENRYFLNSEGTIARSGHAHYVVSIAGSTQASDGMLLQRSHADQGNDLKELPTREAFLKTTARFLDPLELLRDARGVDEDYRRPVLFLNDVAA